MSEVTESKVGLHGQWSSRWAFFLAATGSAVGLGNIWKFPYITGENGGGAFVVVYLLCIALIGLPIMMAEIMLGRRGRMSPINTMQHLAHVEGRHPAWKLLGYMGVLAGFLILSYYSVIAGWALAYVFRAASGVFSISTADGIQAMFGEFVGSPESLLGWHTIFMVMVGIVVSRGVSNGLEKAVRFLMPGLLLILLVLVGYALNTGSFQHGVNFLFTPDFSKLNTGSILTALGHAFFTLSLGMGAIMVYGSYLPKRVSITQVSLLIVIADTVVALLAGLAIFPVVFANGLEPAAGPSLIFQTLPLAFGQMPGGLFFGTLFFVLLVVAAWTSGISLIEPAVAWLVENLGHSRTYATVWAVFVTWVLGLATLLSFNKWAFSFNFFGEQKTNGIFDILDLLTANFMLPVGGILIAIFAGWKMKESHSREELDGHRTTYELWLFVIKFISPVLVLLVILHQLGLFRLIGLG